jgi:ATP-dependent Clp protease ATP-binding subunit ClpC
VIQRSELAERIVAQAHREAVALRHEFVGTEHLLLALSADTESVGSAVLRALGVKHEELRERVRDAVQPDSLKELRTESLPLTARAVKALSLAEDAAHSLNHPKVAPEHLLIGMLMDSKSIASQILSLFDVTETRACDETMRVLGSPRAPGESP